MQRIDRTTWIQLIISLVVAGVLVAMIPIFGIVGGHAEHGVAHDFAVTDTQHVFGSSADGVMIGLMAHDAQQQARIDEARRYMRGEYDRYVGGEFGDEYSPASDQVATQLAGYRDEMTITYQDVASGAMIQVTSRDPDVVALLHQWIEMRQADHGDHAQ
ncbi:MAG: hypothetical protein FJ040_04945 [Chloroflexi bacterium]|nr:hypothetical protein [Chloroflexota bacterium]